MRVITVVLPPDAAKSEVADIEIASNASIYSLKEKIQLPPEDQGFDPVDRWEEAGGPGLCLRNPRAC